MARRKTTFNLQSGFPSTTSRMDPFSLLATILQIKNMREKDTLYSYNFSDVVKGQVYLDFYGMTAKVAKDSEQIAYDENDDTDEGVTDANTWYAQTFTIGSNDIWFRQLDLKGDETGAASDPTIYITEVDGSNLPDMTKVIYYDTGQIKFNTPGWSSNSIIPWIKLDANTTYAIVMDIKGTGGGGDYNIWRSDSSSPTYTGGQFCTSTDSGSSWSGDSTTDAMFRIYGITTNPFKIFPGAEITSDSASSTFPVSTDTTAATKLVDVDFDYEVQFTFAMKGLALLTFETTTVLTGYVKINLIKYDGTTETNLASTTCPADTGAQLAAINITSLQSIKRGETLRLNIQFYSQESGAGSNVLKHGGGDLILRLPVKLIGVEE